MRWNAKLLVILAFAFLAACEPTEKLTSFDGWPAVSGFVRDQDGNGINGVEMILRGSGGKVIEKDTTAVVVPGWHSGYFGFYHVVAGQYTLTITPPVGYVVPASQANPINISVTDPSRVSEPPLAIILHKN